MSKVIAALSTPAAPAGLGVIRISGDGAIALAEQVFRPAVSARCLSALSGYQAVYGSVMDVDGTIDECIATVFHAPHSYTGEEVVELSCHGGVYLLRRTLRALFAAGADPAAPGEFTRRAFLNGKMDLTGAEGVMQLISADGRLAAGSALAAREGSLFREVQTVRELLVGLQAQFSAFVDYPYDDIPELDPAVLDTSLADGEQILNTLLARYDAGRVLRDGIDTVIVGSPNVGKSTLMNLLSGCDRSIVTPIPGTTRDIVEETVLVGDVRLRLADTAGIRDTADTVEALGVKRSRNRLASAALVLAVFDGSCQLSADDRELLKMLSPDTTIALINKQDLPQRLNSMEISSRLPHTLAVSAKDGTGREELESLIADITGVNRLTASDAVPATERQREAIRRASDGLREAREALCGGLTLDAVSVSIDSALSALLELTGERATQAVVDGVFSRFCVGK